MPQFAKRQRKKRSRKGRIVSISLDSDSEIIWNRMVAAGINMSGFVQDQLKYHHAGNLSISQQENRILEELVNLQKRRDSRILEIEREYEAYIQKAREELNATRDKMEALQQES